MTCLLERKLGEAEMAKLPDNEKKHMTTILFGGCMGHKDLNAFKYGVAAMNTAWPADARPVLLANKANSATIELGQNPADSDAVRQAVDASSFGGVKLASLAGALFRHKNDITGYQEIHRYFMEKRKEEDYGIKTCTRFPDTSNTRYQSHSYAVAELMTFQALYIELMQEVIDGKTKSGEENHMEKNVLKGLQCRRTQAEMAAIALYGVSVSWPYLSIARGSGNQGPGTVLNLLDTTDLHRRIVPFCRHIANNPRILLDPDSDLSMITLDGQEYRDPLLIEALRKTVPELDNLDAMIQAMFNGAADG